MINLIMPMAGAGSRFLNKSIRIPKPLIDLKGKPFFYRSIQSLSSEIKIQQIVFIILKEHVDNFSLDQKIKEFYPDSQIIIIDTLLNGPVFSVEKGIDAILDKDIPIIVNDCDHYFSSKELTQFLFQRNYRSCDGALLLFPSNDPRYSYAKIGGNGFITETKEKEVISQNAICGAYLFSNAHRLKEAISLSVKSSSGSELYMSQLINLLLSEGRLFQPIQCEKHISFGTPEELELALQLDMRDPWICGLS